MSQAGRSARCLAEVSIPSLPSVIYAYGFSYRKRALVQRFVGKSQVRFIRRAPQVPERGTLLLWGNRPVPSATAVNVQIIRLEDGFLRSVGLGADLVKPVSWVMDTRGIYFDATHASDLEYLLQTAEFSQPLIARAARLRERLATSGLTKYNVGAAQWVRPQGYHRIILVPGQVETDASLAWGAPGIKTNMGLLEAVRATNPEAYIVYKPHPDVVAGLRRQGVGENEAWRWCDEIVPDVSMGHMLAAVDEVHVLTSLAGFEALIRGRKVTCYGQPFYAGWGLTADIVPFSRRTRQLALDELVAVALILYPLYVSRESGAFITPEQALDELLLWKDMHSRQKKPLWQSALRLVLQRWGKDR